MQLRMNFDVETFIPEDNKVRLVCNIVEEMNLESILSTCRRGRKPVVDPVTMLKILLFCYSEGIFSARKIETFCLYDTRAHYLLQGQKAPDHTSINRYRNSISECTHELLTQFVELMIEEGHIDLKSLYIDGTKLESVAGRYTFVWRKGVEKNQQKLVDRMIQELGLPENNTLADVIQAVRLVFNRIRNTCKREHIVFVHGIGKRKTQHQRDYEHYSEVLERFAVYEEHLRILDARNSYSKTDPDATFMRMKEDHMRNGQLKPAYNIQFASNGGFIVAVMASQKSNDLHTLIPFITQMYPRYGQHMDKIVADAGYDSAENFAFLKRLGLRAYIKPANYEQGKKKKVREDIGRKENMIYLDQEDAYQCKNGKKLVRGKDSIRKYDSGFEDIQRNYTCYECAGCPFIKECIKSRKETQTAPTKKSIRFSPEYERRRNESYANITSEDGIEERTNRTIQAEGQFSKAKCGLDYDRFRHRGLTKTVADTILMALGINLNKLHSKLKTKQQGVTRYKKIA